MLQGIYGGPLPDLVVAYQNQAQIYYAAHQVVDLMPYINSSKWGLSKAELADYFERVVSLFPQARKVSNWILTGLLRELNRDDREIDECAVKPEHLAGMLAMIEDGGISGKIGKQVLEEMYRTGKGPEVIVKEKGWVQIQDTSELTGIIDQVLASHPDEVDKYRAGKEKVFGFFVGLVMKATRGQANRMLVNQLLREKLQSCG
jgi:aspartyl-tRNA(Asn)/glutamyl-tRNA(Gln) amidotransferase subunit B